ncbi:hypothetical protein D3C73_1409270 [compost metagenome]
MLAFASRNDRCENLQPGLLGILHNPVNHLLHCLRCDFDAVIRAMRMSDPGKQQAQIIVNLRYRPHR